MELVQDWRKFQRTFYPVRKEVASSNAPLQVIEDRGVVLSVFAEGEDLSDWTGMTVTELKAQFPHRPLVSAQQAQVDRWLMESLSEGHLPAQVAKVRESWIESAQDEASKQAVGRALPGRLHFLIESLERSWWNRLLPSSFGILLRLEGEAGKGEDFLLVYRKGRLEQFGEPDLSFLGADRRADLADVVRYLGERLSVPVQAAQLAAQDWKTWSEQAHPWKEIAWAIQSKRVQLVPFRWRWVGLVATRGFIGL